MPGITKAAKECLSIAYEASELLAEIGTDDDNEFKGTVSKFAGQTVNHLNNDGYTSSIPSTILNIVGLFTGAAKTLHGAGFLLCGGIGYCLLNNIKDKKECKDFVKTGPYLTAQGVVLTTASVTSYVAGQFPQEQYPHYSAPTLTVS